MKIDEYITYSDMSISHLQQVYKHIMAHLNCELQQLKKNTFLRELLKHTKVEPRQQNKTKERRFQAIQDQTEHTSPRCTN